MNSAVHHKISLFVQTVVAGILLTCVHMAIVQIDGIDEMDIETTMEHGTTPTVSCKLGDSSVAQNETAHATSCVSRGSASVFLIFQYFVPPNRKHQFSRTLFC